MGNPAHVLFDYVLDCARSESISNQITLYEALREVIPDEHIRARLKILIVEAKAVQRSSEQLLLDFRSRNFTTQPEQ